MRIEWHPRILSELVHARDYHNDCMPGLGEDFLAEFDRRVTAISANPLLWAAVAGDVRRALTPRFRYAIFYRITSADVIFILVLKHQRRHPKYGFDQRI